MIWFVWTSVRHPYKSRAGVTSALIRAIISIDLLPNLGTIVCHISLLPVCKVEIRVKQGMTLECR